MKSTFMGALADNKFNRILDNDLSESVNVIFLIIQHFWGEFLVFPSLNKK